jgi:Fe-S-cluster containining protein
VSERSVRGHGERVRKNLLAIYDDVERRTQATAEQHAWWPCRRGCDTCCHRLAEVPRLVRAEWKLLREGLDLLAPVVRAEVDRRIEALAALEREGALPRHVVCPMLDEAEGACRVYAHRPGACRTYGFYVERGIGLHCAMITEAVAARPEDEAPIVWGNAEGVDYALARLGDEACEARLGDEACEPSSLTVWATSPSSSPPAAPDEPSCDPSRPSSAM